MKKLTFDEFCKLSQQEKIQLTKIANLSTKVTPTGNGVIFTNEDTGRSIMCPTQKEGVSGMDLMDYSIYIISDN